MPGARINIALLLLAFWAAPVAVATGQSAPTTLTASREITVELEGPTPSPSLDTASLEILLGGQATRLLSAHRAASPWQIVLYFDANLATREGLTSAAAALTQISGQLVQLGEVDVVSANPWPEALAENERDELALSDALAWVSDEAESASEIVITREEFLEASQTGQADSDMGDQAGRHELRLLRESREALLGWLSLQSHRGPRCLILVQDGFDLTPQSFYSTGGAREPGVEGQPPSPMLDFETLTRDLAADGWTVLPLTLANRPEVLSSTPAALQGLADASGGRVITSPTELAAAIAALANRWQLTYEVSGSAAADPRPLEIHSARSDWTIRGPRWGSAAPPASLSMARARWMIEEPDWLEQGLPTQSVLLLDQEPSSAADATVATLEALMLLPRGLTGPFRISLLLANLAGEATVTMDSAQPGDLSRAEAWHYRRHLEIPPDTAEAVVVIEDLRSGLWGAANADIAGSPLSVEGLQVVEHTAGAGAPAGSGQGAGSGDVVVRLLPPRKRPVTGRTRFNTLISNPAVRRVDFYLDGEMVVSDDRPPLRLPSTSAPNRMPTRSGQWPTVAPKPPWASTPLSSTPKGGALPSASPGFRAQPRPQGSRSRPRSTPRRVRPSIGSSSTATRRWLHGWKSRRGGRGSRATSPGRATMSGSPPFSKAASRWKMPVYSPRRVSKSGSRLILSSSTSW